MNKEKHLVLSDLHIPDHDLQALEVTLKFIEKFKPDHIHLLGDMVNFNDISSYDKDPYYELHLEDEVYLAKSIFKRITDIAHKVNPDVKVDYYEGNHEVRLQKWLGKNSEVAQLELGGEKVLSIPHLFELKSFGIRWIPYSITKEHKNVAFNHGTIARVKGGYGAHALLDKNGISSIQGHSHKLAFVGRTRLGETSWAIENGCLCNIPPTPRYVSNPDWQQGFTTIVFEGTKAFPTLHPIVNGRVYYNGEIIRA